MTSLMRPGRGAHDHDPRGQEDRLRDGVGHEETVVPVCAQTLSTSALSRSRVISSSAPNGSSMSRMRRLERERPGDRHALLHAARQLVRVVLVEVGQLDQRPASPAPALLLRAVDLPRISSGSRTFASTVRQSNRTGAWKTIP